MLNNHNNKKLTRINMDLCPHNFIKIAINLISNIQILNLLKNN